MSKKAPAATAKPRLEVSSEEEQTLILDEAKKLVNMEAFYMKRCLDNAKLMEALKHASNMIGQLRTGLLTPKHYYELYIATFDQLRYLESYLFEEKQKGERMSKLYELVQYAGNILPRLYLLVTVGAVYIKSKEAPAKDVLRDLVEMCKGVQHPTRGLFLRNYLSEMTKDKLPDINFDLGKDAGDVNDSIDFILQNFTEMNKLWVRMQHQGGLMDKDRREQERQDLRLLVGKNLARLSQLEGVDLDKYTDIVLPRITKQIIDCKDQIAQQYLMECLIQVFPDEFHLATLGTILEVVGQLSDAVDIKTIVVSLIDRLASYAERESSSIPSNVNVFDIFYKAIGNILEQRSSLQVPDALEMAVSLMNLSLRCYKDNLQNIDLVLSMVCEYLSKLTAKGVDITKQTSSKQIVRLLNIPLEAFKNILTVLKLDHYAKVTEYLTFPIRKRVSLDFAKNAIDNSTVISSVVDVDRFFEFIAPLIKGDPNEKDEEMDAMDLEDFEEEQNLVASLAHLFNTDQIDQLFAMYVKAKQHFQIDEKPKRVKYTLPPLVFSGLKVADKVKQMSADNPQLLGSAKKVFKFVHETVTLIRETDNHNLALRLFLQSGIAAGNCGFDVIAYEFLSQAFVIYESHISENKEQLLAIELIIGVLQNMTVFDKENFDTLATKAALHSSKLLLKPDQCRCVYKSSHLFWTGSGERDQADGKRVLECLQKSLKIADTCMDSAMHVHLFVEILNEYLYYYLAGNEHITVKYLNSLIALINTNIANMDASSTADNSSINSHYKSTLSYINFRKRVGDSQRNLSEIEF